MIKILHLLKIKTTRQLIKEFTGKGWNKWFLSIGCCNKRIQDSGSAADFPAGRPAHLLTRLIGDGSADACRNAIVLPNYVSCVC